MTDCFNSEPILLRNPTSLLVAEENLKVMNQLQTMKLFKKTWLCVKIVWGDTIGKLTRVSQTRTNKSLK